MFVLHSPLLFLSIRPKPLSIDQIMSLPLKEFLIREFEKARQHIDKRVHEEVAEKDELAKQLKDLK